MAISGSNEEKSVNSRSDSGVGVKQGRGGVAENLGIKLEQR